MNNLNRYTPQPQSQRPTTQIGPKDGLKDKIRLFNTLNKNGVYNIMDSQQTHFHITRITLEGQVKSKTPICKEQVVGFEDETTFGLNNETQQPPKSDQSLDSNPYPYGEIISEVMPPLVRRKEINIGMENKNKE